MQLKNIAERMRVYSIEVGKPAQAKPTTRANPPEKPPEPKKRSMLKLLGAGIVAVIVIAAGAWHLLAANPPAPIALSAAAPAEAAHLSIVLLPFTNLSGDPTQDYFADGLTDCTTDLCPSGQTGQARPLAEGSSAEAICTISCRTRFIAAG